MTPGEFQPLTRHRPGSIRELATISTPMVLSGLSGGLMMFVDRIFLSYYSLPEMNAVVAGSIMTWLFALPIYSLAAISEVFVGRYNGAGEYHKLGKPVWQLVWLCLLSSIIFIPLALWGAPYLLPAQHVEKGQMYFSLLLGFIPLLGVVNAITGYYIGRGKTRKIMLLNLFANFINIGLDIILIYGVEGFVQPMGATGAAIGTILGQLMIFIGLSTCFFDAHAQKHHGILDCRFDKKLMKSCIRIGGPASISHFLEMLAHTIVLHMLSAGSAVHMTLFSLGHTFLSLMSYVIEGVAKGGTAVISNFIGAKKLEMIGPSVKSLFIFLASIILISGIPAFIAPKLVALTVLGGEMTPVVAQVVEMAPLAIFLIWLFMVLDGFVWMLCAVFTAAGDTIFMMIAGTITVWLFYVSTVYLTVMIQHRPPMWVWYSALFYVVVNLSLYGYRYASRQWVEYIHKTS